jgi:murein hydrolase activator
MKKYLLTLIFIGGTALLISAQPLTDKTALEKERKEIQNELKEIQGMYNQVKGQTKQSLAQLNMLKRKISLQERYINTINNEVRLIDDDIYLSNLEIYRLQKQLDTAKTQYARTVTYAYKNRSSFNYVNFIFSATSFNDAIRRVAYLKSYRSYREKQVANILEMQQLIARRQQQQLERKNQKNDALQSQTKERNALADQRKEKDVIVSKLKSQEKDLQKQIAAKKKRDKDLQNAIAAIIRREIDAAKKEAARKADEEKKNVAAGNPSVKPLTPAPVSNKPASYLELNATDVALGADFSNNRGKLPWPVDNGFVSIPFGIYTIDETKIRGDNPGLTISTQKGSAVKSVFDGEVSAIHNYGEAAAVVIRHGKYFTSYSNLSGVSVSKGARVKTGQVIGRAGDSDDGSTGQVDFMLMIESNNVNPALWLRR